MPDLLNGRPPTSFWIIGGAALTWNLVGLVIYIMQVSTSPEELAAAYSPEQVDFMMATPKWATSAFAIAVNAGVLGSLFLLFRKAWAVPLFILSLLAIVVQDIDAFVLRSALDVWGTDGIFVPTLVVVIGVALVWYSRGARDKGWVS